ncbi:MAG: hypothetical protein N3B17_01575 [Chlorobi bacterium]|jgi:hypothetical protein|nr:hypothetical protein [Chlorobiota bacterium]
MKTLLALLLLAVAVFFCTIALVVIGQEVSILLAVILFVALVYAAVRFGIGRLVRL